MNDKVAALLIVSYLTTIGAYIFGLWCGWKARGMQAYERLPLADITRTETFTIRGGTYVTN